MQVSVETTEGLGRKLTLEIPAEKVDGEVEKRIADTAKKARIPGFRAGKVPKKVVKQRFGGSIRGEVLGTLINESFQQAVTDEALSPVGSPQIDITKNSEGENVELTASFEVMPTVELKDISSLTIEKYSAEVLDSDVEAMIQKLQNQHASWAQKNGAADTGDKVNIDFVGKKDGDAFEGGSADGVDLELGSGQMIPGFEDGLVGLSAGDKTELDLTFPEDYHASELAGAAVNFAVTINSVSEKSLPELDDEFFKRFDVEGSLEEFKVNVRENMETQLADAIEQTAKRNVLDALADAHTDILIPEAMRAQEIEAMRENAKQRFGDGQSIDDAMLPDELFYDESGKRVVIGLLVTELVKQHEIKPTREDIVAYVDKVAASYDESQQQQIKQLYLSDEKNLQQISMLVVEQQAVNKVLELAQIKQSPLNYDEVIGKIASR